MNCKYRAIIMLTSGVCVCEQNRFDELLPMKCIYNQSLMMSRFVKNVALCLSHHKFCHKFHYKKDNQCIQCILCRAEKQLHDVICSKRKLLNDFFH